MNNLPFTVNQPQLSGEWAAVHSQVTVVHDSGAIYGLNWTDE
ncbi:hypothetical protein [Streptomyces avermitilis]